MSDNSDVDNDVVERRLIGPWQIEGNATLLPIICSANGTLFFCSACFSSCISCILFSVTVCNHLRYLYMCHARHFFPFEQGKQPLFSNNEEATHTYTTTFSFSSFSIRKFFFNIYAWPYGILWRNVKRNERSTDIRLDILFPPISFIGV